MHFLKMLPFCLDLWCNEKLLQNPMQYWLWHLYDWTYETVMPLVAKSTKNQVWWQNNVRNHETKAIDQRSGRGWWMWHVVWSPDCSERKGKIKDVKKYRVCQTSRKLHEVRMTDCSNCWRTPTLPWGKCLVLKSLLSTGTDSTQRSIQVHKPDLLVVF